MGFKPELQRRRASSFKARRRNHSAMKAPVISRNKEEYHIQYSSINLRSTIDVTVACTEQQNIHDVFCLVGLFCIDGSESSTDGKWRWSDGQLMTYYSWGEGQPNGGQYYMSIFSIDSFGWHDISNHNCYSICEVPAATMS